MQVYKKSGPRKLTGNKTQNVAKFQEDVWLLSLQRTAWKQRRNVLASEKGLQLIRVLIPPVINRLNMKQFVFLDASVYKKKSTTQLITGRQLARTKLIKLKRKVTKKS